MFSTRNCFVPWAKSDVATILKFILSKQQSRISTPVDWP